MKSLHPRRRGAAVRAWPLPAHADVKVGVTISTTGPAASLGIPQRNSIALLPKGWAGSRRSTSCWTMAGDSTRAVANLRKLIDEGQA